MLPVAVRIASEGMRWNLSGPNRSWSQRELGDRLSSALTRALVNNEPDLVAEVQPELVQVAEQLAFCWNPPPAGQGEVTVISYYKLMNLWFQKYQRSGTNAGQNPSSWPCA